MPSVSALARSLSRPSRPATPVAVSTLAFSRSVQEPQTRITPPLRRTPPGQKRGHPPSSSRGKNQAPRFRCHLNHFRRLNDDAPPSLPGRAILERLPGPHLTGSSPAFSLDAHHDSLQLTQLQGGLTPTPTGPTPEGHRSSISRTVPPVYRAFYTAPPSAFVTHGLDDLAQLPVQRLDRVRRVDHAADLSGIGQERGDLLPVLQPAGGDHRVAVIPLLGERWSSSPACSASTAV